MTEDLYRDDCLVMSLNKPLKGKRNMTDQAEK